MRRTRASSSASALNLGYTSDDADDGKEGVNADGGLVLLAPREMSMMKASHCIIST